MLWCCALNRQCSLLGVEYVDNVFVFERPGIGHIFFYLFIEGTLFLLLAMLIEVCRRSWVVFVFKVLLCVFSTECELIFCCKILSLPWQRKFFLPELKQTLYKKGRIAQSNEALIWEGNKREVRKYLTFIKKNLRKKLMSSSLPQDDDVFAERKRVASLTQVSKSDALVIKNIVKVIISIKIEFCPLTCTFAHLQQMYVYNV